MAEFISNYVSVCSLDCILCIEEMMRDIRPWSMWDWDFSAVKRGRMQVASGPWRVVMETHFAFCWTYRISLWAISISAENIWGFHLQRRCLRPSLKGSHSSLEEVMGGKQKEINSRSMVAKMLILLQMAHGFKVKKGLGGRHINVMSAFLCDTWRTRNWSQSVKWWWNPVSSQP